MRQDDSLGTRGLARRRPHRNQHNAWRSQRKHPNSRSLVNDHEAECGRKIENFLEAQHKPDAVSN